MSLTFFSGNLPYAGTPSKQRNMFPLEPLETPTPAPAATAPMRSQPLEQRRPRSMRMPQPVLSSGQRGIGLGAICHPRKRSMWQVWVLAPTLTSSQTNLTRLVRPACLDRSLWSRHFPSSLHRLKTLRESTSEAKSNRNAATGSATHPPVAPRRI